MVVTIADATLRQNVYEYIYDALTAASFTTSSAPTITAAYIDKDQQFPQIVINPIDVDYDNATFAKGSWDKTIKVLIDVYTRKNKDKDILSDEIMALLDGTLISGVSLVGVSESNALDTYNDNKVHLKSLALTYRRRG